MVSEFDEFEICVIELLNDLDWLEIFDVIVDKTV
jgi:hypothetical protein